MSDQKTTSPVNILRESYTVAIGTLFATHSTRTHSMVHVFLGIFVILQKELNFIVHLWPNVVAETASNDGKNAETE
jgi:hypothetical protein